MSMLHAGRPSLGTKRDAREVMEDKPRLVRVNFEIEDRERRALKAYAAKNGRSVSDILKELVRSLPTE